MSTDNFMAAADLIVTLDGRVIKNRTGTNDPITPEQVREEFTSDRCVVLYGKGGAIFTNFNAATRKHIDGAENAIWGHA